ncbi:MAG: hypothetical protein HYU39_01870 [Thaumarchaeota archaeon]|nr:hypothetical protein [Nitrososphaerota archaeon]
MIVITLMNRGLRKIMDVRESSELMGKVGRTVAMPIRFSLYIAMLTGVINVLNHGISPIQFLDPRFYSMQFGEIVVLKFLIAPIVLVAAVYHSRIGRLLPTVIKVEDYQKLRKRMIVAGWLALFLTFGLTVLGTLLGFA